MSTVAVACQLLRWSTRNASAAFISSQLWRRHLPTVCIGCRLLCHPTSHEPLQPAHNNQGLDLLSGQSESDLDLSLHSLEQMGFTETQAEHVCAVFSQFRGSTGKHALSTITALFVLGLNAASMLKVFEKCPELYTVREAQLQQRINNLRKLGFVEGSLQRVVVHYPQILTVPAKKIRNRVAFLHEKCLFTMQQVTGILRDSPAIVMENIDHLEYKFQYVYFRMGVKQAEMVKSKLFRLTLDEVRNRHCFLERRGLYETPDKNGQTMIINPKLDSVLNCDEDTFLKVAKASAEEYDVFKRLVEREWQQQEQQLGSFGADSGDEEEEEEGDDEEQEEETGGRDGYRKRKKRR